jgi:hypothetical protein
LLLHYYISPSSSPVDWTESTHIMSKRADRPEVTAAMRKKSLALKKPVIRATRAAQLPT